MVSMSCRGGLIKLRKSVCRFCPFTFLGCSRDEKTRHDTSPTAKKSPGSISTLKRVKLLNPLAAALDQNDKHDNRKDSGYDSNDGYIIHINSPFLMSEIFVETFHYGDCRRTQRYQKQRGEDKQHERKDK